MERTYDELLAKINYDIEGNPYDEYMSAIRAVVELHKPMSDRMPDCAECVTIHQGETDVVFYPCPTIQAIEEKLNNA